MTEPAPPTFLQQPVTALRGVGDAVAEKLVRLGILRVADLLFHLPLRYQDRTRIYPIASLKVGQEVLVEGEIDSTEVVQRGRTMLLCHLNDGSGILDLTLFPLHLRPEIQLAPRRVAALLWRSAAIGL